MRKVFYTHSKITDLLTEKLLEDTEMNSATVILARGSVIENKSNASIHDSSELKKSLRDLHKQSVLRIRKVIAQELLKITQGEEFILYTPTLGIPLIRALQSSPLCKGYYLMEEGTLSHLEKGVIADRFKGKTFEIIVKEGVKAGLYRLHFNKWPANDCTSQNEKGYRGAFYIFDKAFPKHQKKQQLVIDWSREMAKLSLEKVEALVVLDACPVAGYSNAQLYYQYLHEEVCSIIKQHHLTKVHYKLHPEFKADHFIEFIPPEERSLYVQLNSSVCLESLCMRDSPIIIASVSTIYYMFRSRNPYSVSIFPKLLATDQDTRKFLNSRAKMLKQYLTPQ